MRWIIVDKKVPVVRFKGFTDDWEQRKLTDVASKFMYGLNVASKYYDGTNKYLRITDIDDLSHNLSNKKLTSPDSKDIDESYLLKQNDLLFARTGASVGKTYLYKSSDGIVYFAGYLIKASILDNFDSKFIFNITLTTKYNNFVKVTSQRSGQPRINAKEYSNYKFKMPNSLKEQKSIGYLLNLIDDLVALYQEQLNLYQQLQKELLQRMFVSHRQSNPTIRFSKFYDTWELQVISKCFKNIRNAFVGTATPFYVDKGKGHFYLESNNVKNGTINRDKQIYINEEFYLKQSDKLLHSGDMVMVQSGSVGNSAIIPPELDSTAAHALIMFQSPQEKINSKFINFFFQTSEAKSELRNITTGNTIQHILASDMAQFKIKIPTKSEQNKIQKLFDTTVHIIDFYNKRINDVL